LERFDPFPPTRKIPRLSLTTFSSGDDGSPASDSSAASPVASLVLVRDEGPQQVGEGKLRLSFHGESDMSKKTLSMQRFSPTTTYEPK